MSSPEQSLVGSTTTSPVRAVSLVLGALLTFGTIADAADLYRAVGLELFTEQKLIGMLGIALALVFLVYPVKGGQKPHRVPWYDFIAAIAGFAACAFVAYEYERIFEDLHLRPDDAMVASLIIVVLTAEGLRRAAGNVLFVFLIVFILIGLFGHFIPGQFQGRNVDIDRMLIYIAMDSNGLVGIPMIVTTTIIIAFVFFGNLLAASGGSGFFTDISTALMGRYRGGSSKIAVTASSLFGAISGSAVSNVVSTGVITIPMMRRGGYSAQSAAAIEAVASTGGQLMPPMMGAAAFVMAEFLQIEYRDVVLAALIPAILYYVALFIQVDLVAGREGITAVEDDKIPDRWPVFRAGWLYMVPFAVVILGLFWLNLRPHAAALWAALSIIPIGLFVGYQGARMNLLKVVKVLAETGITVVQIVMIGAMAGMIIGVLNITGLGFNMTQALILIAGGNLFLILAMAAVISIILGMGMPTLGVYLLLATLVAPSMVELGVQPMAAHLFALYFGMLSMITPPVAIAAFAAANVAGTHPMPTAMAATRFGWSAYIVPFLFVLSPELLMEGTVISILWTFATACIGIWFTSAGITGYFVGRLTLLYRLLFIVAGLSLMLPASAFDWALWSDVAGGVLALALGLVEKIRSPGLVEPAS